MQFVSSRNPAHAVTLSQAIALGLASDGGLFVPDNLPRLTLPLPPDQGEGGLAETAEHVLRPFFAGDPLEKELGAIAREAFDFPAPLVELKPPHADSLPLDGGAGKRVEVLELFHGPTAAFKDFGARFLASCMRRHRRGADKQRPLTILVATSGDTGGAVAAAFHGQPWAEVFVLFPQGLVSPRQQQQLTCWGGNVRSFAVRGSFDDCQRLVKGAFADPAIARARDLSSANSINIGRLLPQLVYYAAASLDVERRTAGKASFIVPSGNLGNVMACVWARAIGLPIERIVLAHNANRTVPDYLRSGRWEPRPSVATLASAMDVGDPSNMERLRGLYPQIEALREKIEAFSVDDDAIRARIRSDFKAYSRVWCPHSATAAEVYAKLPPAAREAHHWVLVATAHPAKFSEIVEPLIGREVEVPRALQALLALPSRYEELDADPQPFRDVLVGA